ncbi:hypothetical protein BH20CHL1_BH20CHL1_06340 [soil metagenome]
MVTSFRVPTGGAGCIRNSDGRRTWTRAGRLVGDVSENVTISNLALYPVDRMAASLVGASIRFYPEMTFIERCCKNTLADQFPRTFLTENFESSSHNKRGLMATLVVSHFLESYPSATIARSLVSRGDCGTGR